MNKTLITIIANVFVLVSCTNSGIKKKYYDSGELRDEYQVNHLDKNNGYYKKFYKSGQLEFVTSYKNDKKNGNYTEFYEDGKLKIKSHYKDGLVEGIDTNFYENGKLQAIGTYIDGKENGAKIFYYSDGKLDDSQFVNNGILQYEKKYDSSLDIYTEYWKVSILAESDSVKRGSFFRAKVHFFNEERFSKAMIVMRLYSEESLKKGKNDQLASGLPKRVDDYYPGYKIEFVPPKTEGIYYLEGDLRLIDKEGGRHVTSFSHRFVIYDDSPKLN